MQTKRTIIGAHGFFFPEGKAFTEPADGICGRESKPGADDDGWFDTGVADYGFAPNHKINDFFKPAPGARVLYDKITTMRGLKIKAKWMEMHNLTWQLLTGSQALPESPAAGGQYNPLGGDPVIRGWYHIQQYNQLNELINTIEVWVILTLPGEVNFDDKEVDVNVEAEVLFSTLNTGTLT